MKNGDLSNELSPRLLIEFEGLLGPVPQSPGRLVVARALGRWRYLARTWELDELAAKVIVDLSWRLHQEVDVITAFPEPFAEALAERLDEEQIPARRVWSFEPRRLARRLLAMPHVTGVYTASREHALLYGSRARLVTPETITQIGRF